MEKMYTGHNEEMEALSEINTIEEAKFSIKSASAEIEKYKAMKGKNIKQQSMFLAPFVWTDKKLDEKITERTNYINEQKKHYNL